MARKKRTSQQAKPALDIVEEAVHLFRTSPAALIPYYIGSLPFMLALLYFWADMIRNPYAARHCAEASLGLALLFLWMKSWQAVFIRHLMQQFRNTPQVEWSPRRILRLGVTQAILQPWGMIMLPLALLLTVPFPWAYAFYQNITVFGYGEERHTREVAKRAWQQAKLWSKQNTILIWLLSPWVLVVAAVLVLVIVPIIQGMTGNSASLFIILIYLLLLLLIPLSPVGMVISLNIGSALLLIPQLLKTFLGIETIFTLSLGHTMNTTFFAIVYALAYLCLDPLAKAAYALRCFYGESIHTGEDLRVELQRFAPAARMGALVAALGLSLFLAAPVHAAQQPVLSADHPEPNVSSQELDEALSRIINKAEYTWRAPREQVLDEETEESNLPPILQWIADMFEGVFDTLDNWGKTIGRWLEKIMDWLDALLPERKSGTPQPRGNFGWMTGVQALLYVLLAAITCFLAVLLWRAWRRRRRNQEIEITLEEVSKTPDITEEHVDARELPEDGWLAMAKDLMAQGQFRLALRALYLASLACLAEQNLISIARFKSDRDYARELQRRAHSVPSLLSAFGENMLVFERTWYGEHEVNQSSIEHFTTNYQAIKAYAER